MQIDGVSGEAFPRVALRFTGPSASVTGMDFSSDGTLYLGASNGNIYTVDTASGVCTQVASSKVPISGLGFNPLTGELWLATQSTLLFKEKDRIFRMNLQTGDTMGVGNTGFGLPLVDIDFDERGNLYGIVATGAGSPTNRLARIDTATGRGTEIGSFGVAGMNAIAFSPDTIASGVASLLAGLPEGFKLEQNYPNPFNPSTTIRYGLPSRSRVTLTVFNTLGQQVATLVQGEQEAGYHEVQFDGSGLASGVYVYRLQAGDFGQSLKLTLLR